VVSKTEIAKEPEYSLVIPVYNNAETIPSLVADITGIAEAFDNDFQVVYVIDGSPDNSSEILRTQLIGLPYDCVVIEHARNFGSFAAIRTGMNEANGRTIAVRSADLQEPASLIIELFRVVASKQTEVAVGVRQSRKDDLHRVLGAKFFWSMYRRFVQPQMPRGGIDVFACSKRVSDQLLELKESNSSLVGLLIWLGFQFSVIPYDRLERVHGRSQWRIQRLIDYLADSAFAFGRAPIRLIRWVGIFGVVLGTLGALALLFLRLTDQITAAGYTPLMLTVLLMGSLNLIAIGTVGSYVWRAFENSKLRPHAVVKTVEIYGSKP
jgi:polyisoprenyl-phosphate glycosyltransferase